jgi:hypothetical protein
MAGPLDLNFGNYIETGGASDFGATGTTGATGITTTTRAGSSSGAGITSSQLQGIGMGLAGIGAVVGGITDIGASKDIIGQAQEMEATWSSRYAQAEQELKRLKESQPSLSTPSEYFEMAKKAYDDKVLQMQRESIGRAFATTTEAAQRYGSRGLGAVIEAQGQAVSQEQAAILAQQQREIEALRYLGSARQTEQQLKEQRSAREIGLAYDERVAAEAGLAQAQALEMQGKQMKREAAGKIVGGLAGTAVGLFTGGFLGGTGETGMKVRKTPGKFSHDTNPLHVVDNDGKKVAEVTGGEYILNPTQAEALRKMSAGDAAKLKKYVKQLVKKFEK